MSEIVLPSPLYTYVRARQLEGSYSADPDIGAWVTSACRIGKGWGNVSWQDWPYIKSRADWPPVEPAGLDEKAKSFRISHYYRVRSADECRRAIGQYRPVVASFDITSQWFTAAKGRITMPSAGDKIIGGHCVCVAGYDYSEGMFFFPNSWGAQWGDDGHGSMSFEYFDKHMTEAWVMDGLRQMPPHKEIDQVQYLNWGIPTTLGVTLHGVEVYHYRTDARIGWAFCVQHHDVLEIEELFVRPDYRGKGYGRILAKMILELKDEFKLPIRLWIPHPDATPSKLPFLTRFLPRLGVSISPSPFRWASLVANSGQGTGMTSTPSISPSTPANLFPAVENA